MLTRMKIVNRLLLGFSLVLLGVLILGFMGVRSIFHLSELTTDIFAHPFTVSTTILEIRADILAEQQDINRLLISAGPLQAERMQQKLLADKVHIDKHLAIVAGRFLGDKLEVDQIRQGFSEWCAARDEVIALVRTGHPTEATALNYSRNARMFESLMKEIGDVSGFAADKAASFQQAAEQEKNEALQLTSLLLILIMASGIALSLLITRSVRLSLKLATREIQGLIKGSAEKIRTVEAVGAGDLSQEIVLSEPLQVDLDRLPRDEIGMLINAAVKLSEVQCTLDQAFRQMTLSLRLARDKERDRDWLKSGRNELYSLLREGQGTSEMADRILAFLVEYLKAGVGALYLFEENSVKLNLTATYAGKKDIKLGQQFRLGEGLIGQAAREQKIICLSDVPPNYLPIGSALGESAPKLIAAIPLLHGNRLVGVVEMGTFGAFSEIELRFLDIARETIAIGLDANLSHQRMAELLEETQSQAEELRVQQEELQQSNEELEERAQLLEQQRENIRAKNLEIEATSDRLRQKAAELELVSAYKSEFLANMSHELRTPLNSLMILSGLLMQNKSGNLSGKQVEYASTINGAGKDLLNLINDILDLSKVEAGQLQFHFAELQISDLCSSMRTQFEFLAEQKGLAFHVEVAADAPATIQGDAQRIQQILKNLLSNALKFTAQGQVSLRVDCPAELENPLPVPALAFAVADTGIGISPAKQQLVFHAFQQADGSISRKYGGTGLGLSISLQLARQMGGEIRISSQDGQGSVFTLYLPLLGTNTQVAGDTHQATPFPDQRLPAAASRALAAEDQQLLPAAASWPDDRERLQPGDQSILIIEDDPDEANSMVALLQEGNVEITVTAKGSEAIELLAAREFDCMILDLGLADMSGFDLLEHIQQMEGARRIPVIIHSGRDLSYEDERKLRRFAESIIIKGAKSPERLLNEVSLFLHLVESKLHPSKQRMIRSAIDKEALLEGKKVLLVDDDMRNVFSLTNVLAEKNMSVIEAENGHEAIARLEEHSDLSIVLMDIMMPEMDGYAAMREIRKNPRFAQIPIIAMTAKALKGDQEKCLAAGANDYIAKPIEVDKLLSLIRVWIFQR